MYLGITKHFKNVVRPAMEKHGILGKMHRDFLDGTTGRIFWLTNDRDTTSAGLFLKWGTLFKSGGVFYRYVVMQASGDAELERLQKLSKLGPLRSIKITQVDLDETAGNAALDTVQDSMCGDE
ncbi:hypothetical protein OF83DRAFT_1088962 [Amylostereum chailletii]|nr:hypothetical protein OF83DRAFT_1088962 [Amylostereum chailletii]